VHWSTATYSPVQGAQTVYVRQVDLAGNASTGTPVTFTYDTVGPVAAVVDAKVTTDVRQQLTGTVSLEGGGRIEVEVDGMRYTPTPDAGGHWTVAPTADLTLGIHTVTAYTYDAADNVTSASATVSVVTAPTQHVFIDRLSGDSGDLPDDFLTNDGSALQTVQGHLDSALLGNQYVEVSFDGGASWAAAAKDDPTHWHATDSASHAADWTIQARVADPDLGVFGTATRQVVTYDHDAPGAVSVALVVDSGTPGDRLTRDPTLKVSYADGAAETGAHLEYSVDGGAHWGTTFTAVDGLQTVQVRQVDAAGNASGAASLTFTYDHTIATPTVALGQDTGSSAIDGVTSDATLKVVSDSDATFLYSTDGGTVWSNTFAPAPGAVTVLVRATDAAGNTADSAPFAFTYDPAAPADLAVSLQNDSGTPGDGLTRDATLAFGNREAGSQLEYSTDNVHWSTATYSPVQGAQTVYVRQVDLAGNASTGTPVTFTYDTVGPAKPSIDLVEGNDGINAQELADGVPVTGTAEAGATITVNFGTFGSRVVVADNLGYWSVSYDNTQLNADGSYALTAIAVDAAGNASVAANRTVTIKTAAPSIDLASIEVWNDHNDVNPANDTMTNNGFVNDSTPLIKGVLGTGLAADEQLEIYVDGNLIGTASVTQSTLWSLQTPYSLSEDVHTFTARVVDSDGNRSAFSAKKAVITVDVTEPAELATIDRATDAAGTALGVSTANTKPVLGGGLDQPLGAGDSLVVYDNGAPIGSATVGSVVSVVAGVTSTSYTWSYSIAGLAEGEHTFTVAPVDAAGNIGAGSSGLALNVDLTSPTAVPTFDQVLDDHGPITGPVGNSKSTDDDNLLLSGSLDRDLGTNDRVVVYDGTTVLGTATVVGRSWSFQAGGLGDKRYAFNVGLVDLAGHTGPRSTTYDVLVNTQPPSIPKIDAVAGDNRVNSTEASSVLIKGTATPNSTVNVNWMNGNRSAVVGLNSLWTVTYTGVSAPTGTVATVIANATDADGNKSADASLSVKVDTQGPTRSAGIKGYYDNVGANQGTFLSGTVTDDAQFELIGTVSGVLDPDESVIIYDGVNTVGTAQPASGSTDWRFTVPASTVTAHSFQVAVTDIGGNVSSKSGIFSVSVVTTLSATTIQMGTTLGAGYSPVNPGGGSSNVARGGALGDIDGDGLADMAQVMYTNGGGYVAYGKSLPSITYSKMSMSGADVYATGANVGDINGDGLADTIFGSPVFGSSGGRVSLMLGHASTVALTMNQTSLVPAHFVGSGAIKVGDAVSGAGDFNGDGIADFAIGASGGNKVYLVLGKQTMSGDTTLTASPSGVLQISATSGAVGTSVASAGDVNGDGLADLIIGAPTATVGVMASAGKAYVVFGRADTTAIDLDNLGTAGFEILGTRANGKLGGASQVSTAGDINGDGLADLFVSSSAATGTAYVVFGKTDSTPVDLANLGAGGIVIKGENDFGFSVASARDYNGDGIPDLLVSAWSGTGKAYVIFGRPDLNTIDVSSLYSGENGFVITNATSNGFGDRISSADTDGDGLADILISATGTSQNSNVLDVVMSSLSASLSGSSLTYRGTTGNDSIDGSAGSDRIAAGLGKDTVFAKGGRDVIYTGAGDDLIVLNADSVGNLSRMGAAGSVIDGGSGNDTVQLSDGQINLDLHTLNKNAFRGIEHIDLGGKGNTLSLRFTDLFPILDENHHSFFVEGTSADSVTVNGSGWTSGGTFTSTSGKTYNVYTQGSGLEKLLIENSIGITFA
jgi:hypothetical protein